MKHPKHYYLRRNKAVNHENGFTWSRSTGSGRTSYQLTKWINGKQLNWGLMVDSKLNRFDIADKLKKAKRQFFYSIRNH